MLTRLKKLHTPDIETLNTITISKENILNNIKSIEKLQPNSQIFPVLKSNAYGHWINQILKIIKGFSFPYIVVDSFPEYQIIHNQSKFNILLLWETLPKNYQYFDTKRTTFAIYNIETLKYLISLNKKIKIHLFLNTGMNREWIQKNNLNTFLELVKNNKKIELEWVMSHLHSADEKWEESIHKQITLFKTMFEIIKAKWFNPKWKHIWASAWMIKINDSFFNARRPWLIFYGYSPFWNDEKINLDLKPALTLNSTIISIQNINKGEWISYNQKRIAQENAISATVPFWYYEWRLRKLWGKLFYYQNNVPLQQVWTICMNLSCCIANKKINLWDKIELIWIDKNKKNTIEYIANQAETIPYEILIRLDKGIRRTII